VLNIYRVAYDLEKSGFTESQAEAVVSALKDIQKDRPTKLDVKADLATLEARLIFGFGLAIVILETVVIALVIRVL